VDTKRRSVLVVDDDHDLADNFRNLLNRMGYPAAAAYDAGTALRLARAHPPQVVFLDVRMPGGGGLDLARRLRLLLEMKDALLICLSGLGTAEDRRLSREAGCDHHLLKPVDWDELLRLLEQTGPHEDQ
jgi:DNA-binding response OmpR family regulator